MVHVRFAGVVAAVCGLALSASAMAADSSALQPTDLARQSLTRLYPEARFADPGANTHYVFGTNMTVAGSPEAAAAAFLDMHSSSLGIDSPELAQIFSTPVMDGKFTAFGYDQYIGGVPVEGGLARVLVLTQQDRFTVVYATGKLVELAADQVGAAPSISGQQALDRISAITGFDTLDQWTQPELVVFVSPSDETNMGQYTWRFTGRSGGVITQEKMTFFVSARDGSLLDVRNEVHNIDVSGLVQGMASPGSTADHSGNPPVMFGIPETRMTISGGNNAFSDVNGNFLIANPGTAAVTVSTNVSSGRWVNVNNMSGGDISASSTITPGVPGTVTLNASPGGANSLATAQVNALIHTDLIHNFFTDRAPGFNALNTVMPANVNLSQTCNAFYDGVSINFFRAGGGCNNTAFSSVVAHEYGHHIVNRLGLAQGAFGEGYGDCSSVLLYDDPLLGRFFFTGGGAIRNANNTQPYPCAGAIHFCGQVLSGSWWSIRQQLGASLGSQAGLDLARDEFIAWSLITSGGIGDNAAHPGTAIEVLTVDDDDGDINNGTPNNAAICAAFAEHNIDCPLVVLIDFVYPNGQPTLVGPGVPTKFEFDVVGVAGTPVAGSGFMTFSIDGAPAQVGSIVELSPNMYSATLPAVDCGQTLAFTVGALAQGNATPVTDASGNAQVGQSMVVAVDDNFQTDTGFSVQDTALSTGSWDRGIPGGFGRGSPGADFDGSGRCWVTGNAATEDVDGGPTRLISSTYDLTGAVGVQVSYALWHSNDDNDDVFQVHVSNNNGASWVLVASFPDLGQTWNQESFLLDDFVTPTSQVKIRFSSRDNPNNSVTESAIDALKISYVLCESVTCPIDFNNDGVVDVLDFFAFITLFNNGDVAADLNADGNVDVLDFFEFINLFSIGC